MANFDKAYERTIVGHEGGYRNVAWDAGGETYRGITRKWFPNVQIWAFIDAKKANGPIANNTKFPELEPIVKQFYYNTQWARMQGDALASQQLAEYIFDFIIQSGMDELKNVQICANNFLTTKLTTDGVFGPVTVQAINSIPADKVYNCVKEYRENYYLRLLQLGKISSNDWNGIKRRLASFPWMEAAKGGGAIVALLLLFYIANRVYYA